VNKPGEGLTAPIPPSRDDNPLGPVKLAERELTVNQALDGWDQLHRIARDPSNDAAYPTLRRKLVLLEVECLDLLEWARADLDRTADGLTLTRRLDISKRPGDSAYIQAREDHDAALAAYRKLHQLHGELTTRLTNCAV
jgi:hypothetical protein